MKQENKHYGLGTAISMIVGICIGSGIFFKADDILRFTGGNIRLSVLVFFIGAFCVIFGNITLSQLASRTDNAGGVVAYFEEFISPKAANAFGWFQMYAYYPSIAVVVSWVAGIYTTMLFNLPSTLEIQVFIGMIYLFFFHILNYFSLKLGGRFQNISTVMKIIPLLTIAIIGFFSNQPHPVTTEQLVVPIQDVGVSWLAALVPIAFSFDGWVISTSITHEVRNAKKTMPIALTIGPLIVLGIYLAYFLGMSSLVGPEYILANGDNTIYEVGNQLFGSRGGFIILFFILIAVLGVVNGLVLGNIRLPQSLAAKGMIPNSKKIRKIDNRTELSPHAAITSCVISLVWMVIHYFTQKTQVLSGGDVSEIAIVFSYITYVILYWKVIQMKKQGIITSPILGVLFPILGMAGSGIIVIGGVISNPIFVPLFLIFCLSISLSGYFYQIK
ncbi:APC family permease [Jeotgalibaca sp. MA1X17-3]|uniref:APC family permease n=1 Tax=Jeotgalibaca sp. MA1X17-3 TaxID=2908211 RepID=UPI001F31FF0F|nr:APC family permease [Jeotgalibaca sp. MA1X17-3]UJF15786.1 APC family permease [Jeotgalibaca sp. MA1X17-3]